MGLPERYLSTQ